MEKLIDEWYLIDIIAKKKKLHRRKGGFDQDILCQRIDIALI